MASRMKIGLAAGALGIGVTTLSLVGSGVTANFTAAVKDNQSLTSGDFHLQAIEGLTYAHDPHYAPATPGTVTISTTSGTSKVTFTQTNANPNDTYKYQFTVYDSGTLKGEATTVVYTPTSTPNSLMDSAVITVEQCKATTGCSATRAKLTKTTNWVPLSSQSVGTAPFAAYTTQTLHFKAGTGSGLNGFLATNTPTLKTISQGWISYRVIVTFLPTTPNSAENQAFTFNLSVTGHAI